MTVSKNADEWKAILLVYIFNKILSEDVLLGPNPKVSKTADSPVAEAFICNAGKQQRQTWAWVTHSLRKGSNQHQLIFQHFVGFFNEKIPNLLILAC